MTSYRLSVCPSFLRIWSTASCTVTNSRLFGMDSEKKPAVSSCSTTHANIWPHTHTHAQKSMHDNERPYECMRRKAFCDYRDKYLCLTDVPDREQCGATEAETLTHSLSKASVPWVRIKDINFVSVLSGAPLTLAACEIDVQINLSKVPEYLGEKDRYVLMFVRHPSLLFKM